MHVWTAEDGFATHTAYAQDYPGPFPFLTDPGGPPEPVLKRAGGAALPSRAGLR